MQSHQRAFFPGHQTRIRWIGAGAAPRLRRWFALRGSPADTGSGGSQSPIRICARDALWIRSWRVCSFARSGAQQAVSRPLDPRWLLVSVWLSPDRSNGLPRHAPGTSGRSDSRAISAARAGRFARKPHPRSRRRSLQSVDAWSFMPYSAVGGARITAGAAAGFLRCARAGSSFALAVASSFGRAVMHKTMLANVTI